MRVGEPLPVKSVNRSSLRLEGQGKSTAIAGIQAEKMRQDIPRMGRLI